MASGRWKAIRQRFGIAAPRVAVQTQIPWYLRWAAIAIFLGIAGSAAGWIYDAGRRYAGFDRSEVVQELEGVKAELAAAQAELARLRAIANAADSKVAIERTAQQKLAQQVRALEQENARVREELAMVEAMLTSEERHTQTVHIYRFKVEPDVLPGEYRYRLHLLTPTDRRGRDFSGRMELVVSLQEGGQNAMMSFPEPGDAAAASFRLAFKYFRRVEGTFRVNPKAKVESVQVRIYEAGSPQPRATQSVTVGA
jgi:hypothetical protein